ncbi:hypothetical protein [Endozoicomonas sp. ONNA1]|uniref:hypothetical protein n=1 Tax=Endozoicomonas sp. ONNA1 TaxID=2828740 RepID=UPI0021484D46|nr:hypothetical protein [Endozoicomonas sp. ONNA1]
MDNHKKIITLKFKLKRLLKTLEFKYKTMSVSQRKLFKKGELLWVDSWQDDTLVELHLDIARIIRDWHLTKPIPDTGFMEGRINLFYTNDPKRHRRLCLRTPFGSIPVKLNKDK